MIRVSAVCAAALVLSVASAHAQDARTTRIITTPAYGATVSVEHGVRVYRPLPPEQHVIVNPGGRTPLSLHTYEPGWPLADQIGR